MVLDLQKITDWLAGHKKSNAPRLSLPLFDIYDTFFLRSKDRRAAVKRRKMITFAAMKKAFKEKDLQYLIGTLLRFGVLISMGIVIIGLSLFMIQNGSSITNFSTFDADAKFNFAQFLIDLKTLRSGAIITLGVICLIATPILRVVFSIIGFAMEKDKLFVFISSIVLVIIIASMFLGAVE